jgi:hypothetical protein
MKEHKTIDDLVIEALLFFDVFDKGLSYNEIKEIVEKQGFKDHFSERSLSRIDGIKKIEGEYVLRNADVEKYKILFDRRKEAVKYFNTRILKYVPLLKYVPFIKMVAVCNAIALGAADKNSDIDLFIVTSKGRIFFARTVATILFFLLGVRRYGSKVADRFCLTFFVTEESLNIDDIRLKEHEDIYLKYWILRLKPIFGLSVYARFMDANGYFPVEISEEHTKVGFMEKIFSGRVGNFIEKILKRIHLRRMKKKRFSLNSSIVVSDDMLKFHDIDMREYFFNEYDKRKRAFTAFFVSSQK